MKIQKFGDEVVLCKERFGIQKFKRFEVGILGSRSQKNKLCFIMWGTRNIQRKLRVYIL